ncbi:YkvA family protein [Neobacillus sp. SM06]|uniref:YkvA family protein n=1 Tax=Neobacillus sp. SM06 TaxID=3422492 RepID=UPI003D27F07B
MLQKNEHDLSFHEEKYELKAKEYLNKPKKTDKLLTKAVKKAMIQKDSLGNAWDKLKLLTDLVRAYTKGDYRNVSPGTILTVIGAIIYFVSPVDLVPDFIVGLGLFDDAAVIGFTLKKIASELEAFKHWQTEAK